jgi:hypothetical protein
MVAMADTEGDPRVLMKFYERCMSNPDPRSIDQLWPFLEHNGIPLTKDGCFLAYKAVRPDLKDAHSGTMTYAIGKYISMPREDVQNDPNIACAPGLHVGAKEYVYKHYRDDSHVMLVVKVDPADVVSVPHDYRAMKLRACGMLVLGYYGSELPDLVWGDEDIGADALDAVNDHIAMSKGATPGRNPQARPYRDFADSGDDPYSDLGLDGDFEDEDTDEDDHYFEDEDTDDGDDGDDGDDEADEEEAAALTWLQDELEAATPLTDAVRVFTPEEDMAYSTVDATDEAGLSKLSIDLLRKYASAWLSIVGASKIPGGKPALIAKIMKVRGVKAK